MIKSDGITLSAWATSQDRGPAVARSRSRVFGALLRLLVGTLVLSVGLTAATTVEAAKPKKKKPGKGKPKGAKPPPRPLGNEVKQGVRRGLDAEKKASRPARSTASPATQPASDARPAVAASAEPAVVETVSSDAGVEPEADTTGADPSAEEETGEVAQAVVEEDEGDGPAAATEAAADPVTTALTAVVGGPPADKADRPEPERAPFGRVAAGLFELDVLAAGAARGWVPQQYPTLDVSTKVYATWQVDVRANIAN